MDGKVFARRFLALFLCVSIISGACCSRARAVVVDTALLGATLVTFLGSMGIAWATDDALREKAVDAIVSKWDEWRDEEQSGAETDDLLGTNENGLIGWYKKINSVNPGWALVVPGGIAKNSLVAFASWLVSKYGLQNTGNNVEIADGDGYTDFPGGWYYCFDPNASSQTYFFFSGLNNGVIPYNPSARNPIVVRENYTGLLVDYPFMVSNGFGSVSGSIRRSFSLSLGRVVNNRSTIYCGVDISSDMSAVTFIMGNYNSGSGQLSHVSTLPSDFPLTFDELKTDGIPRYKYFAQLSLVPSGVSAYNYDIMVSWYFSKTAVSNTLVADKASIEDFVSQFYYIGSSVFSSEYLGLNSGLNQALQDVDVSVGNGYVSVSRLRESEYGDLAVGDDEALVIETGYTGDETGIADWIIENYVGTDGVTGSIPDVGQVEKIDTYVDVTETGEGTIDTDNGLLDIPVLGTIVGWLQKIWAGIMGLPVAISNAIAWIFVPDAELLNSIQETVLPKFEWAGEMHSVVSTWGSTDPVAPRIRVPLSLANSQYFNLEDEYITFDWYLPYKSQVDSFLSGVIWLGFLWILWKRVPDIISGSGVITDAVTEGDMGANGDYQRRIKERRGYKGD